MPGRNQFTPDPPKIETVNNHVGSYRKTVEIPASWKGQQVFLHVGSATSELICMGEWKICRL